jgi:hypothetical protein
MSVRDIFQPTRNFMQPIKHHAPIAAAPRVSKARLVEFFKGMGLTYVPPDEG